MDTIHRENLEKIGSVYPEKISEWKHFNDGFDSHAYQINREWIFKIPRRDDVWNRLIVEKDMLNLFAPDSPVAVPRVEFFGERVLGYRMVRGRPLTDDLFKSMNQRNRDVLAEGLGQFLSKLHTVAFDAPGENIYRGHFFRSGFEKLISQAEKDIYHHLPKGTVKNIEEFLNSMRSDEDNFTHRTGVVHADLHHSHILWDEQREQLAGIIDFGEMSQNAVAADFAYLDALYVTENSSFLKRIISSYEFAEPQFLEKIQRFSKFELLFWPTSMIESAELSGSPLDMDEFEMFLGYIKSSYGE